MNLDPRHVIDRRADHPDRHIAYLNIAYLSAGLGTNPAPTPPRDVEDGSGSWLKAPRREVVRSPCR